MRRLLVLVVLLQFPSLAPADGMTNAYFLCDVFARTGVSNECLPSNASSTVDVIINTTEAEARNVCAVIARNMLEKRRIFGGWQLRIFAPGRAQEPLAACALK